MPLADWGQASSGVAVVVIAAQLGVGVSVNRPRDHGVRAPGRQAYRPRARLAPRDDPPMAQPATTASPQRGADRITEIAAALAQRGLSSERPARPLMPELMMLG